MTSSSAIQPHSQCVRASRSVLFDSFSQVPVVDSESSPALFSRAPEYASRARLPSVFTDRHRDLPCCIRSAAFLFTKSQLQTYQLLFRPGWRLDSQHPLLSCSGLLVSQSDSVVAPNKHRATAAADPSSILLQRKVSEGDLRYGAHVQSHHAHFMSTGSSFICSVAQSRRPCTFPPLNAGFCLRSRRVFQFKLRQHGLHC